MNNIKIGCDIIENSRLKLTSELLNRILHSEEIKQINALPNNKRKIEFLAGRWAAKEAIIKTLNKKIPFSRMLIFYEDEKPSIKILNYEISLSIAHEKKFTIANCITKSI